MTDVPDGADLARIADALELLAISNEQELWARWMDRMDKPTEHTLAMNTRMTTAIAFLRASILKRYEPEEAASD